MLENYYSSKPTETLLQDKTTLAIITHANGIVSHDKGVLSSGLASFENNVNEVWQVLNQVVERGTTENCQWSKTHDLMFVSILGDQNMFGIERATEQAYSELLHFSKHSGYDHLIRFWNYLPAINSGLGDDENYKIFCAGRLKSFGSQDIKDHAFPSASAVGHLSQSQNSSIAICAIVSKHSGTHFSNSLQTEAYQYPRQYGASSPSFARATSINFSAKNTDSSNIFFISGTASIRGHETVHKGNLMGQLKTTHSNIEHLLKKVDSSINHLKTMKVYVRHESDLIAIKEKLAIDFPGVDKLFIQADICRDDLLVEIECFCV